MALAGVPTVFILSVGTEVTSGDVIDTNAAEIARAFTGQACRVVGERGVPDDLERMVAAFRAALAEADVVVATGGLGPTADDLTRDALALAVGRELVTDADVAAWMVTHYQRLGRPMPEENLRQARLPEGGRMIPNPHGTAPGIAYQTGEGRRVYLLPGPPREMRPMLDRVLAELAPTGAMARRTLRVSGVGESQIDEWLADLMGDGNPSLRPYAKDVECHLQIAARADDAGAAGAMAEALAAEVRRRLGPSVYAEGDEGMEHAAMAALQVAGMTVAVAESLTAGLICGRLASVPGASATLIGGVVAYTDAIKRAVLGVSPDVLAGDGAVSAACAAQMAVGVRALTGADLGVSATGWAGPTSEDRQPVGTVYYGIADANGVRTVQRQHLGQREHVRRYAAQTALDLVRRRAAGLHLPAEGGPVEAIRVLAPESGGV